MNQEKFFTRECLFKVMCVFDDDVTLQEVGMNASPFLVIVDYSPGIDMSCFSEGEIIKAKIISEMIHGETTMFHFVYFEMADIIYLNIQDIKILRDESL